MKINLIATLALAICFTSCIKQDIPSISVFQEEYIVDSSGGEIIIPVLSTGIDDVTLKLGYSDKWITNPTNGDRTPAKPWITISRIIESYPQTKALNTWTSAVVLSIEPNETKYVREATVQMRSFSKTADVKVVQAGHNEK